MLTEFLVEKGAAAVVVACNTATAAAAATLRERFTIPIVAMEPAVKPAVGATRSGVVGVLATVGTLESAKFAALLEQYAGDVEIVTQACPGLVEQVEAGELDSPATRALLERYTRAAADARRRHTRARLHSLSVLAASDRGARRSGRAAHRHGRSRREAARAPACRKR